MEKLKEYKLSIMGEGHKCDLFLECKSPLIFVSYNNYPLDDAGFQLIEGAEYEYFIEEKGFELRGPNEIVFPSQLNRVRGICSGIIRTGIYVGHCELEILFKGESIGKIAFEIQSKKMNYLEDYKKMLLDITEYYTDLIMIQGSPVSQRFEVNPDENSQTLYQKYSFIRSIIESDQFAESIHKIVSNPIRRWSETFVEKIICNVRRFTNKNIREITRSAHRTQTNPSSYGLPSELVSLPSKITVATKKDSLDTTENQFIKFALIQFRNFCSSFENLKNAGAQLKRESMHSADIVGSYLKLNIFKDISLPQQLNLNSPALQRKEGYREVLQAWIMFDLAASITWEGGDYVYEAGKKNIALLYEYWLFFKLLEIVGSVFKLNEPDKKELVKYDSDKIDLDIIQGKKKMISGVYKNESRIINVRFYYNRTFSYQNDLEKSGSWTTAMRPDYTLSVWPGKDVTEEEAENNDTIVHLHFDAKYRLNQFIIDEVQTSEELDQEKIEQAKGTYKRGDILKMHAYKDAIRRTSGAYILYPGSKNINRRGFHEIIPGLGAFCIRPGEYESDVIELKNFIENVVKHLLDRTSQREKITRKRNEILKHNKTDEEFLHAFIPENIIPDETNILIGKYNSVNHEVILEHGYPIPIGNLNFRMNIRNDLIKSDYILLFSEDDKFIFSKVHQRSESQIMRQDSLEDQGYLFENEDKDNAYQILKLNPTKTEREFLNFPWDKNQILEYFSLGLSQEEINPKLVILSELIMVNKKL